MLPLVVPAFLRHRGSALPPGMALRRRPRDGGGRFFL